MDACLLSSNTDQWSTPRWLVDACDAEWGPFDLDPAADEKNAKAPRFYTATEDGLHRPWWGRVWCNPPYGTVLGAWVERMAKAADSGEAEVVVGCIPARTDTSYWHAYAMRAMEIRFLRGRVAFGEQAMPAPFPTAIVVWHGKLRPVAKIVGWDLRSAAKGQLVLLSEDD